MNDEQKSKLLRMLDGLVAAEAAVIFARRGDSDLADAIDVREVLIDQVVAFVESLGEPIAAVLDATDPRAGLRRCEAQLLLDVMTSERTPVCGYFHHWTDHGEAVVELANGECLTVYAEHYRFTDISESGKE